MRDTLLLIAEALIGFVRALGVVGFFLLLLCLVLLALVAKFLDAAMSVFEKVNRQWKRLHRYTRWTILCVGGFYFAPTIWHLFPWRAALIAALLAFAMVFSVGGIALGQRYGGEAQESPWAAWSYHLRVTAKRRRFGKGVDAGTGKKRNQAVSMRMGPSTDEIVARPGEGLSARDLATQFNDGTLTSSIANQFGWRDVKDVNAVAQPDNTVLVWVAHQVRQPETLEPEWVAP